MGPYSGAVLFGLATAVTLWVRNGFRSLSYFDLFVLVPFWSRPQRAMRSAAGHEANIQVY